MIVAVAAQGRELDSKVDPRLGRAEYFVLVNTETGVNSPHDNAENVNAIQGAGTQTAQMLADAHVDAVIAGNVGPRALQALKAAGIKVYIGATGTVNEAIGILEVGGLQLAEQANVAPHWA